MDRGALNLRGGLGRGPVPADRRRAVGSGPVRGREAVASVAAGATGYDADASRGG